MHMAPCCCHSLGLPDSQAGGTCQAAHNVQLARLCVIAAAADPEWLTGYADATDELH
jgi:hypothetical protein